MSIDVLCRPRRNSIAFFFRRNRLPDFQSTFAFSPLIDGQIANVQRWQRLAKIIQIPTLVVNGRTFTDTTMVPARPERLVKVLNYLIEKERRSRS